MHIVRFRGGFANQLFQLCLYYRLIEEYGESNVFADLSFYKTNNDHGGFKLNKWFKFSCINSIPAGITEIREDNFSERQTERDCLYIGYWQDTVFFPNDLSFVECIISQRHLTDKNLDVYNKIIESQSVSLHIRRGDYLDNPIHGNIANPCYIHNAITYFREKLDRPVFFVFSDDIQWCENNIDCQGEECYYIKGNEKCVEQDLILMSSCKYNVIANSSFSWWAQFLNRFPGKMVISPEYWYNEKIQFDALNLPTFIHVGNVLVHTQSSENPFFSILIPVYNKEDCIRRVMASVLNQTFDDIEVVVIDDGSTDRSYSVLKEYENRDARIKLIRNEENRSLLMARIIAMREAKGEYILFVDSDDYCAENMCEILHKKLKSKKLDILEFSYIREPEKKIIRENVVYDKDYKRKIIAREIPHTVWNKCYSAELINRFLKCIEEFYCNMTEDVYFSSIFSVLAKSYDRIDDVLYHYVAEGGMTNDRTIGEQDVKRTIESIMNRREALKRFLTKNAPELNSALQEGEIVDLRQYAYIYLDLNQPVYKKMSYLNMLDEAFDTDFEKRYDEYVQRAIRIVEDYKLGGRKRKLKLTGKLFIQTLRNMKMKGKKTEDLL